MTKMPTLLTINEAAALLRVHRNTLNRWRRAGSGPPRLTLPNGGTRYDRDQLLTWLSRDTTHQDLKPVDSLSAADQAA
jgi:DNA-binding transcriptional MerR regulator